MVCSNHSRIPKGAVLANAIKRIEELKETGYWVHNSKIFDHNLCLPQEYREIVDELFQDLTIGLNVYKQKEKKKDLEILIANLLSLREKKPLSISLNKNSWIASRYKRAGYFVIELVKIMEQKGLIRVVKKGFHSEKISRMTRIEATKALLTLFPDLPNPVIYEPIELVELRDDHRNLLEYEDTDTTRRIREILERANSVNARASIWLGKYKLSAFLTAIFINRFSLYGRLHTRRFRHFQGFAGEERREITINGDPVVEIDFSGLHPRLLYAKEQIQFNNDPYSIIINNPDLRPFLKETLLRLLNSKKVWVKPTKKRKGYWMSAENVAQSGTNQQLKDVQWKSILQKEGITKAKQIIELFYKAHKEISHYFCKDDQTGLRIMNLDSKIALDIVDHFTKQEKPILPVHDSFVVQCRYEKELQEVMNQAYSKHSGGFACPVTIKKLGEKDKKKFKVLFNENQ